MDNPRIQGGFCSLDDIREPLVRLLRDEIAGAYLVWFSANANAVTTGASSVSVEIGGMPFAQKPQRYAAKAFAELRRKRGQVTDHALAGLLEESGCDAFLKLPAAVTAAASDDDDAGDADNTDDAVEE